MPTVKSIIEDIEFVQDHPEEYGTRIAPMLRNVAALNTDANVNDFVEAAVEKGFHPATAKTCFYKGRKMMLDLDAETATPPAPKRAPKKEAPSPVNKPNDLLTIDPEDEATLKGKDPSYIRGWNQVKRSKKK